MRLRYDPETDTLTILLRSAPIRESDEISPSVIADYGWDDEIVGFEVLRASTFIDLPDHIEVEKTTVEAKFTA